MAIGQLHYNRKPWMTHLECPSKTKHDEFRSTQQQHTGPKGLADLSSLVGTATPTAHPDVRQSLLRLLLGAKDKVSFLEKTSARAWFEHGPKASSDMVFQGSASFETNLLKKSYLTFKLPSRELTYTH